MPKPVAWLLVQFLQNDRIQDEIMGGDGWGGVEGKAFGNERISDPETELWGGGSGGPSSPTG